MKKIILSATILAGLASVSCNKDDNSDNNSNCVTCTAIPSEQNGIGSYLSKATICKADNGNAIVNDIEIQKGYNETIDNYTYLGSDCK